MIEAPFSLGRLLVEGSVPALKGLPRRLLAKQGEIEHRKLPGRSCQPVRDRDLRPVVALER